MFIFTHKKFLLKCCREKQSYLYEQHNRNFGKTKFHDQGTMDSERLNSTPKWNLLLQMRKFLKNFKKCTLVNDVTPTFQKI